MRITGTFIDEITYDIPSQNWSDEDWDCDLAAMQAIGIDTVIIIRGGFRDRVTFPSRVVGDGTDRDLAGALFDMTTRRGMKMYFGLYTDDSWIKGDWRKEVEVNRDFCREVLDRYGDFASFAGWYLPQEGGKNEHNLRDILLALSQQCKELAGGKKVLLSPFFYSSKLVASDFFTPEQHGRQWRAILAGADSVDHIAFQDTAGLDELGAFLRETKAVLDPLGIDLWANVETFERSYPIKFPPIDFEILRRKIDIQSEYACKLITFEFSHFMSPNSMWLTARNLYNRYRERYVTD